MYPEGEKFRDKMASIYSHQKMINREQCSAVKDIALHLKMSDILLCF